MIKTVQPFSMEDKPEYLVLATDDEGDIHMRTCATQIELVRITVSLAKLICEEDATLIHTLCEQIKEAVLGDIANAKEEQEEENV